jgi:zinc transporter ZupT
MLASVGAVGAAALFLLLPERMRRSLLPMLISFATGTLLASALLELLPHAIAEAGAEASLKAPYSVDSCCSICWSACSGGGIATNSDTATCTNQLVS